MPGKYIEMLVQIYQVSSPFHVRTFNHVGLLPSSSHDQSERYAYKNVLAYRNEVKMRHLRSS